MAFTNAYIHNTAIGANANFFASDLVPGNQPSTFRVFLVMSATSPIITTKRTNTAGGGGTVTETWPTVTSGAGISFDVPMAPGDTFNLQSSVAGTILTCIVREIGQ